MHGGRDVQALWWQLADLGRSQVSACLPSALFWAEGLQFWGAISTAVPIVHRSFSILCLPLDVCPLGNAQNFLLAAVLCWCGEDALRKGVVELLSVSCWVWVAEQSKIFTPGCGCLSQDTLGDEQGDN